MSRAQLLRPADAEAYRQALRMLRRQIGVPVAFGGQIGDDGLVLDEFLGTRTPWLRGLKIESGYGVGGFVIANGRPQSVNDYATATDITHHYDKPVLGEGIRAVLGVPVTVEGVVRGVLYGAVRSVFPLGDRATGAMASIAGKLAREISIRDEVDRRVELLATAGGPDPAVRNPAEFAELFAELRSIADELDDSPLRTRLLDAADRMTDMTAPATPAERILSPREVDTLAQISLGCTNAEAARRLSIRPETVKAYLRSASRKLGAHGRYQAVLAARRHGLLP